MGSARRSVSPGLLTTAARALYMICLKNVHYLALIICLGLTSPALGMGTLITADGTTITASRTLVARHADKVQLITQVKYGAPADSFIWLVAIPNFNRPDEDGVRVNTFPTAALDELDALSRPRLQAVCNEMPTGAVWEWIQGDGFGPGLDMRPAVSFYTAAEITMGDLNNYIAGQGFQVSEETQTMIDDVVNKNMMIVAARVDVGALGVARVDPILSISYPAERDSRQGLALQTLIPNLGGQLADVVVFVLNTDRAKMISRTEPLAFDDVAFIDATETNYIAAMDEQLGIHQTRMSVVEYAGNVDPTALTETALSELIGESGSSFLTRLHTRISAAALRAETQAQGIIALRDDPAGDYSRDHQVASSGCSEPEPMEDAGPAEPMADGSMLEMDGGAADSQVLARPDGGVDETSNSGGSDGGCATVFRDTPLPIAFFTLVLLLSPITHRRNRR